MKATIKYKIKETLVQVIHDHGEVVVENGVLIEGEQLCTIYDLDEESFPFVCTLVHELTICFQAGSDYRPVVCNRFPID